MESLFEYLRGRFEDPGLLVPPIQLYAAYLAVSQPPYNTGLYNNLDGKPVIKLDDLVARSEVAAQAAGIVVPQGFDTYVGRLVLDMPQVASILACALGDLTKKHGKDHLEAIGKWAHEVFGSILPLLDDEEKQAGIAFITEMSRDHQMVNAWAFLQSQESCVYVLQDPSLVCPVKFLMRRSQALLRMYHQSTAA